MTSILDHPDMLAALETYRAEIARHQHDSPRLFGSSPRDRWVGRCLCGWESSLSKSSRAIANRSAGLHVSAAWRRASRAYDVETARIIDESRP
jgi:hypothetical protein